MTIVKNLRVARKSKGMTLKELANYLHLGESTISMYENGLREPDNETMKTIADFFEVSIDFLLGREFEEKVEARASPLNDEEQTLIDNYNKLDTHKKMRVQGYIESMLEEDKAILQKRG
jgi:transcriptional regulator with XRE-family HTH domain